MSDMKEKAVSLLRRHVLTHQTKKQREQTDEHYKKATGKSIGDEPGTSKRTG